MKLFIAGPFNVGLDKRLVVLANDYGGSLGDSGYGHDRRDMEFHFPDIDSEVAFREILTGKSWQLPKHIITVNP